MRPKDNHAAAFISINRMVQRLRRNNNLRMKQIIDIDKWDRKDNFRFFEEFVNPWYAVTTEIDCTRALRECKATGESFFLRYLHAILCSANEVEALRYRLQPDGRVVLYDRIDIITPIAAEGRPFVTVRIPYIADFAEFSAEARRRIEGIRPEDSPYGVEEEMFRNVDYGVIHMSAVPKMYFTSMSYTTHKPGGMACTHPLSVVGKAVERPGGRMAMPYSIYVSHAFVDGSHLTDFFTRIAARLS